MKFGLFYEHQVPRPWDVEAEQRVLLEALEQVECESLELFARELHPEFKRRDELRERQKREELAPFIEVALQRKRRLAPAAEAEIPTVEAFGRAHEGSPQADPTRGAIPVVTHDPREVRKAGAADASAL